MTARIRPAVVTDAATLAAFASQTFSDAFAVDNDPDDVARFLNANYSAAHQAREIADPDWTTLLIEQDARLAGFAQLRTGQAPDSVSGPAPVELARFYIGRDWHGRGIAQQLMAATCAAATARGAGTLWLGVWERNPRAIGFYHKCSFIDVGEKTFTVGTDVQRDRVLVRLLPVVP